MNWNSGGTVCDWSPSFLVNFYFCLLLWISGYAEGKRTSPSLRTQKRTRRTKRIRCRRRKVTVCKPLLPILSNVKSLQSLRVKSTPKYRFKHLFCLVRLSLFYGFKILDQCKPTYYSFRNVQTLVLSGNKITKLFPSFGTHFSTLRALFLNNNGLTELPIEICQLGTLIKLHLEDNNLK
jgi:Leucine-rich repeat (LRR) protein